MSEFTEQDGVIGKNIFLKKEGETNYIGLHSIGYEIDGKFHSMESWGNEYLNGKMQSPGSFRVFDNIEKVAKDFELDGYIRFNPETKKD